VAGFVVVVVEEDAGDEGVCFEGEGVACGDGVEDSLADLYGMAPSVSTRNEEKTSTTLTKEEDQHSHSS
jgi:hypothetical protein